MTTPDTTISIGELTERELYWLCVDVDYNIAKKNLSLDETAAATSAIEAACASIFQRWNTIYDHPIGLEEQLKKSPAYIQLQASLKAVKRAAIQQSLSQHQNLINAKLRITGEQL